MPASFFNSMNTLHQNKGNLIRVWEIMYPFRQSLLPQYAKKRGFVKTVVISLPAGMLDFISVGGYSYLTKSSLGVAFP